MGRQSMDAMNRRNALKTLCAGVTTVSASRSAPAAHASNSALPFVGVQVAPHSVYDEGAANMLDFMAKEGGIDTICISTHVLNGGSERPSQDLLADHGVPHPAVTGRPLAKVWIPHNDANFRGTTLRMLSSSDNVRSTLN